MAYLMIEENRGSTDVKELNDSVVLGRSPECDLYFPDRLLSRRHLRLKESGEGWLAIDMDSTNGSWLRGKRITTHLLRDGDTLHAGTLTLWFSSHRPAVPGRPAIGTALTSAAVANRGSLGEQEIVEILNERDTDSVDEDWSEIETPLAPDIAAPAVALAAVSPRQGDSHRKTDTPSLWEIAMKPVPPKKAADSEPAGSVAAQRADGDARRASNPILLRFGSDARLRGAAAAAFIALLLGGGYFWLGASEITRGRISVASPSANMQAPSHNRNGAFDLPV